MALGPNDLQLNDWQKDEVDRLEKRIDDELRNKTSGQTIKIRIGHVVNRRVVNELIDRYKTVGWSDVKYDGYDEIVFT